MSLSKKIPLPSRKTLRPLRKLCALCGKSPISLNQNLDTFKKFKLFKKLFPLFSDFLPLMEMILTIFFIHVLRPLRKLCVLCGKTPTLCGKTLIFYFKLFKKFNIFISLSKKIPLPSRKTLRPLRKLCALCGKTPTLCGKKIIPPIQILTILINFKNLNIFNSFPIKKLSFISIFLLNLSTPLLSQRSINILDFGVIPNSFVDATEQVNHAIRLCRSQPGSTIIFPTGRYDFWPEKSEKREYFISNTSSEDECPSKIKNTGILFDKITDLTIDGNGSTFIFHGKTITLTIDSCENIEIRNLSIDFERPTMSELHLIEVNPDHIIATMHPDSKFDVINSKLHLYGEGWSVDRYHAIMTDAINGTATYSSWSPIADGKVTHLDASQKLRIEGKFDVSAYIPGQTLTVRDPYRDHVGVFVNRSRNVRFDNLTMHYMHGLGIISQFSENLSYRKVRIIPSRLRTIAAFADGMHFSGCRGNIIIDSCRFKGLHDDPVNVHGTYLKISEIISPTTVKVRFMHAQTYGFAAFSALDTIAFVRSSTLLTHGRAVVRTAKMLSEREMQIELQSPLPSGVGLDYCIENISWTPSLYVRNSLFEMTCTRGILATTPRRVCIENNIFYRTGMYGILIACDAGSWYESGAVNDILIRNNLFDGCGYNISGNSYAISIEPEAHEQSESHSVHRNIRIEGNTFKTLESQVLRARNVDGLIIKNNLIQQSTWPGLRQKQENKPKFKLEHCKNVSILDSIE